MRLIVMRCSTVVVLLLASLAVSSFGQVSLPDTPAGRQFAVAIGHHLVKPLDLRDDALAACTAQLLHRGALGLE